MNFKIWKKNKSGKIEIINTTKDMHHTKALIETKRVIAESLLEELIHNKDYGYVDISNPITLSSLVLEVSKTDLVNIINDKFETILTVCFNKKDGTSRILTGYTHGDKDAFGRFYFIEVCSSDDEQVRLVDPRELNWVQFYNNHNEQVVACTKEAKIKWQ